MLSSSSLLLEKKNIVKGTATLLPASKSISNRVLIMNALSGKDSQLFNLSDANDTQLMMRLVNSNDSVIDVEDAGTTMRFLTAYYAITNQQKTITGTARMKERPIGLLVDALRALGATIEYTGKDGYPPIKTLGFKGQLTDVIKIRGDVSSQYISALMMVAPLLPKGLTIMLEGKIGSKPYIEMTRSLMKEFGVSTSFEGNIIQIKKESYKPVQYTVESDWSAASYWFAITALASEAEIELPKISLYSLQGDRAIVDIMTNLGVYAKAHKANMLKLSKGETSKNLFWDFTHCPDLAQTVAVVCAAKGVDATFTGLESLRIKETDRIAALQNELKKIGADLLEHGDKWQLVPPKKLPASATFETYKDHRMAMAFAPLATLMDVKIINPAVVRKSYPNYWEDLKSVGFKIVEG